MDLNASASDGDTSTDNDFVNVTPLSFQARLQRGNVHLKLGNLDEAHIDFEDVVCLSPESLALF